MTAVITAGSGAPGQPPPQFGPNKQNTITVSDRQISATVSYVALQPPQALIRITGMALADMNQIQSLGQPLFFQNNNMISLLAGDDINGMALVFQGGINDATIDTTDLPNIAMQVTAMNGIQASLTPVPVSSFRGRLNAASIMEQLAQLAGLAFENNGVDSTLTNAYLPGTALDQIRACAAHANISFVIDKGGPSGTLAIWPRGGSRGKQKPLISPETGLNGYPSYSAYGVDFRTIFNPNLSLGGEVTIKSSLKPACGDWYVYALVHTLDCLSKNGSWWTDVQTQLQPNLPLDA